MVANRRAESTGDLASLFARRSLQQDEDVFSRAVRDDVASPQIPANQLDDLLLQRSGSDAVPWLGVAIGIDTKGEQRGRCTAFASGRDRGFCERGKFLGRCGKLRPRCAGRRRRGATRGRTSARAGQR